MPILSDDLDPTALGDSNWERIFELAERPTVESYGHAFHSLIDEEEASAESVLAILALLHAVCQIRLAPYHDDGPFLPKMSGPDRRTPLPEDLSASELDVLHELLGRTVDPELQARLADFIWLRRGDHHAGRQAMEAYIASALSLENLGEHLYVSVRLERAIELAAKFSGKQRDLLSQVLDAVAEIVRSRSTANVATRTLDLLDMLLDRKYGDSIEWAELSEGFAMHLESQEDFHPAIMFWDRATRAYRMSKEEHKATAACIRRADAYLELAERANSEIVKSRFVRSAYEAYRQIPGTEEKRTELHKRLLFHQEKSVGEFGTISTSIDLGDAAEQAQDAVRGQDLVQALYSLSLLFSPSDPDQLRKQAERSAQEHPITFMLQSERVNALGRVVGTKPSGMDDSEGALLSMMHEDLNRQHQFRVSGLIDPARLQILSEHPIVRARDLETVVSSNGFVPADRRIQFSRGLAAGLRGDFVVSTLLLVPQLENSLRVVLQRMGVITTGLNSGNRRQNEQSLNVTLYDYRTDLESVFGPEVVFELRNLLIEPLGSNLRNEVMHGLMADNAFFAQSAVYLWWLTLRLCCLGNQGPLPEGFSRVKGMEAEENSHNVPGDDDT